MIDAAGTVPRRKIAYRPPGRTNRYFDISTYRNPRRVKLGKVENPPPPPVLKDLPTPAPVPPPSPPPPSPPPPPPPPRVQLRVPSSLRKRPPLPAIPRLIERPAPAFRILDTLEQVRQRRVWDWVSQSERYQRRFGSTPLRPLPPLSAAPHVRTSRAPASRSLGSSGPGFSLAESRSSSLQALPSPSLRRPLRRASQAGATPGRRSRGRRASAELSTRSLPASFTVLSKPSV